MTSSYQLSEADKAAFWDDGYVIKRAFFDSVETEMLSNAIHSTPEIARNIVAVSDNTGATTELALWNHPGDDVFGMVARSARIVDSMEHLLGGEVYHYHSKLTMKRPLAGGAWDWHQDYGYWYENGCLFPDMASVFIAIDPCKRENGCLEVLRGSHLMGRLNHAIRTGQTGADEERVKDAMNLLDHIYCEMSPGDALFFHCNTLHSSAANTSQAARNVLLCCYNRASNNPTKVHHHPQATPLLKVPDSAVKSAGGRPAKLDFVSAADDLTIVAQSHLTTDAS